MPPLGIDRYPCLHAHDLDQARKATPVIWGDGVSFDRPAAGGFDWRATLVELGPITLVPSSLSGGLIVRGVPSGYLVSISHRGNQRTVTHRGTAEIVPGKFANIMSPTVPGERTTEPLLYSTAVRIDPRFLRSQMETLTGRALLRPVEFELAMRLDAGPGAAFLRLCSFVIDEIDREAEPFANALFRKSLAEAVARALLLGQPHDHAHLLAQPAPPCGPGAVRLAEEYADAHAADPIGVVDLAALAHTSVRALEAGFRVHRDTTPGKMLRQKRLWLARWRLFQSAAPSMTHIARGAGFLRREHFEATYAAELRETPRETRRRGLVAGGAAPESALEQARFAALLVLLTPREREVCEHVSRGRLHKQIAAELGITEKTVQLHRARGMAKLGVGSGAELGRLLERAGRAG